MSRRVLQFYRIPGLFWFRLFGVGLSIKDAQRYPPLFSERYRKAWMVRLGKWHVRFLPPNPSGLFVYQTAWEKISWDRVDNPFGKLPWKDLDITVPPPSSSASPSTTA